MKEILTIQVKITEMLEVKGKTAEAALLLFGGDVSGEYFQGIVLPGGVDTQQEDYSQARRLSARYILEGTDDAGKPCRIFVENNGVANKNGVIESTTPRIITSSDSLCWLEQEELKGTIEGMEEGVRIHIFAKNRK